MMLLHNPLAETFLSAVINDRLDLRLLRLQIFSSLFVPRTPLFSFSFYISGLLRHSLYSPLNKSFHLYTTTCTQHSLISLCLYITYSRHKHLAHTSIHFSKCELTLKNNPKSNMILYKLQE